MMTMKTSLERVSKVKIGADVHYFLPLASLVMIIIIIIIIRWNRCSFKVDDDDAYCRLNKVCLYKREPRGGT